MNISSFLNINNIINFFYRLKHKKVKFKIPKIHYPLIAATILVSILTAFKINGSSIGVLDQITGLTSTKDENLLFGQLRQIRSDEWLVSTPFVISQNNSKNKFPLINHNYGDGQLMTLSYAPYKHWSIMFKPLDVPFFILPFDYAFSLKWWLKGLIVFIGSYLLIFELTKNKTITTLSSLILLFSPFIQWWYSTSVVENIGYALLIIYNSIIFLRAKTFIKTVITSLILVYLLVAYALILYPPYQLSIASFMLIFLLGHVVDNWTNIKGNFLTYIPFVFGIVAVSAAIIVTFLSNFSNLFQIMTATSYPGERIVEGGNYKLNYLFRGFYNTQLINDGKAANGGDFVINQSEGSSFFMLYLFLMPILFFILKNKKSKNRYTILYLGIYLILTTTWLIFKLPKLTLLPILFSQIPENRMIVGIGLANITWFVLLGFTLKETFINRRISIFLSLLAFFSIAAVGLHLKELYPIFINNQLKIILISFSFALSIYLLLSKKMTLSLIVVALISLVTSFPVNPLYRGTTPQSLQEINKAVEAIKSKDDSMGKWAIYNNIIFSNYLSAVGAVTITGTRIYPQLSAFEILDNDGSDRNIYNRYAHIIFQDNNKNDIGFELLQNDVYAIQINPCNNILPKLGVEYLVFTEQVQYECLEKTYFIDFPKVDLFIYRLKN